MNIFLLGGWVARPSAFYFVAFLCSPCLIVLAWSLCFSLSPFLYLASMFRLVALCRPCSCTYPDRTLLALPVPILGIPSISALLGSYLTLNENTPCIFMHFLLTLLHSYAMFNGRN